MRVLIVALALAGCYAPTEPACRLRCGDGGACPVGLACVDQFCAPAGTAPGACCLAPTNDTLYVDESHVGVESGGENCPFSTITAAAQAATPGTTLQVAAGTYDAASGELFPIDLRGGRSLIGAGAGATIVDGVADYDPNPEGGRLVLGVASGVPYRAQLLVGDEALTTRISGVTLRNSDAQSRQFAFAVICSRGNTPSTGAVPSANTIVDHAIVTGALEAGIIVTDNDTSGCNFAITSSQVSEAYVGLFATAYADNLQLPPVAVQVGDGTSDGAVEFSFIRDPIRCNPPGGGPNPFTLSCDGSGPGVYLFGGVRQARILGNRFVNGDVGFKHYESDNQNILLDGNVFDTLTVGCDFEWNTIDAVRVSNNSFQRCSIGMYLQDGSQVTARNNVISGNQRGVVVSGSPIGATRAIDFGTVASPGLNTITCNSSIDMTGPLGFDFEVAEQPAASILPLAGNVWDHVPLNPATSEANGTDLVVLTSPAPTLILDGATARTAPCPSGYMP